MFSKVALVHTERSHLVAIDSVVVIESLDFLGSFAGTALILPVVHKALEHP